ncbi:MAG: 4Fe-4S binding protein [Dehalococcoidia bacterium]|nr:4Fe-4S binding protein [Dehalococcoidia bacterium]
MNEGIYRQLGEVMAKRGLGGRPTNVPEYDTMLRVLFTPDEAESSCVMPPGYFTPNVISQATGKNESDVTITLEKMADKGLCMSVVRKGARVYVGPPLMPGIFEFQFMRGTKTERDYEIARAINAYRKAAASVTVIPRRASYPGSRVIPVQRTIKAETSVQTFDQVRNYIENSEPIAVTTCYCRHEALLIDEKDICGMPNDVCMQFRTSAEYLIERKIGRQVSKDEAMDVMRRAEEAGLVHACVNTQRLDFICNCCACHCAILQNVLRQPRPADAILHAFLPSFGEETCTLCGICTDRCPAKALSINGGNLPEWNAERCIGCAVCASGCPEGTIVMVERQGAFVPPADMRTLGEVIAKERSRADF